MSDKPDLVLTGTVHAIPPPRTHGDKVYPEIVLEIDPGKYPQYPKLECRDSLAGLVANLGVGSTVKAHFNVRGRQYQNKKTGADDYFTSLQVWKLDIVERVAKFAPAGTGGGSDGPPSPDSPDDDIPFATASLTAEPSPIAATLRRLT